MLLCFLMQISYIGLVNLYHWEASGDIQFGIYACSPENSSFKATFNDFKMTECVWQAHDGQQPDEDITY